MSAKDQPVPARCSQIRERLADLAAGRLGPQARGEVRGHLLDCDDCSAAFSAMVIEQIESGEQPLLVPPSMPPVSVYGDYVRARRQNPSWRALLDALREAAIPEWATARLEELRVGFELLLNPVQVRGPVRTRGSRGSSSRKRLIADLVDASGEPTGATVTFELRTGPQITADSRFVMTLASETPGYDGRTVICVVALPNIDPVSFEAVITPTGDGEERLARFDEERLPIASCEIPTDLITLAIA